MHTLSIPLALIRGLYGMDLRHTPVRDRPLGKPIVWLVTPAVAGRVLVCFRRNKVAVLGTHTIESIRRIQ
jgi:Mg2+ and Co2+ transporter CorA